MDCTSFNWVAKQPILTWFFAFLIRLIFFRVYSLSAKLGYLGFTLTCFGTHLRWILNHRIYLLRAMLQVSYDINYLPRSSSSTPNYKHEPSLITSQYPKCEISCTVCVYAPSYQVRVFTAAIISFHFDFLMVLFFITHYCSFLNENFGLNSVCLTWHRLRNMEINIFYLPSSVCKQPSGSKYVNVQLMCRVENEPYETLSTPLKLPNAF